MRISTNKRLLIPLLDHGPSRFALGKMATRFATRIVDSDVQILYRQGLWTHRIGQFFFPDGPTFNYTSRDFERWTGQAERYMSEAEDFWLHCYSPQKGDTVVDIGAGRGEDMLTFSRGVGETGRVIGIEAHPLSFMILTNFCELNGLTNVFPLHLALMDKPGTVGVIESESMWMENAVACGESHEGIKVPAETLDNVCQKYCIENINFLKMNIEGAEQFALPGMRLILPRIHNICVACHDFRADWGHGDQFRTRAFVERFLTENGFTINSRRNDPRDYVRDHVFGIRQAYSH
jgi:FkbM family methyltransferase